MNFRQVISNIKEGQEFKCDDGLFTIRCLNNGAIEIHSKDGRAFGFVKEDTFSKIEKPVSFTEVLNSDKRCRVEHELLKGDYYKEYKNFTFLLRSLIETYVPEHVKSILKNGRWFLEE